MIISLDRKRLERMISHEIGAAKTCLEESHFPIDDELTAEMIGYMKGLQTALRLMDRLDEDQA